MSDRIQLRRDTAANWSSVNPVLAQAEVGVVTDEHYHKVGDGVTPWNDLPEQFPDHIREGDSRLSDARTPTAHTHPWSEVNDKPDLVLQSEIGTAASRDVTTSSTDTTSGRLMKVGDFGLGKAWVLQETGLDLVTTPGFYFVNDAVLNKPIPQGGGLVAFGNDYVNGYRYQIYIPRHDGGLSTVYSRARTPNTGWLPWVKSYNTRNILGTVSQSGGVPTGAIIERGSNANGEYTKFADGTLICTKFLTIDYVESSRLAGSWTFPHPFINPSDYSFSATAMARNPSNTAEGIGPAKRRESTVCESAHSSSLLVMEALAPSGTYVTGDFVWASVQAIGRWV